MEPRSDEIYGNAIIAEMQPTRRKFKGKAIPTEITECIHLWGLKGK